MTDQSFNTEERQALLELARWAISKKLKMDDQMPRTPDSEALEASSGAFVTLHKRGRLRGCIGRFTATQPITDTVQEMARAAAFEDPRFPPVKSNELADLDLEISVLTPMKPIENLEEIEVGRHGIYIINGVNRGVLLPQVAVEQGWDRSVFLEHTCLKAGLKADCYKDPNTEIFIFSAEIFGEKDRL